MKQVAILSYHPIVGPVSSTCAYTLEGNTVGNIFEDLATRIKRDSKPGGPLRYAKITRIDFVVDVRE